MLSIGSSTHLLLELLLIYSSVFVSSSSSPSSSASSFSSSSSSSSCLLLLFHLLCLLRLVFCFSLRLPPSVHINLPWGNLSPLPLSPFHAAVYCQARGSYIERDIYIYIVPGATLPGAVLIWHMVNHLECTSNSLGATSLWLLITYISIRKW